MMMTYWKVNISVICMCACILVNVECCMWITYISMDLHSCGHFGQIWTNANIVNELVNKKKREEKSLQPF